MKKFLAIGAVALFLLVGLASPAMAQDGVDGAVAAEPAIFPAGDLKALGIAIGIGLIVIGAAKGIANIGANAVQSIARQPEAGGRIFTSMLLAAALIEGFTFFALLIQFTL